MSSIKVACFVVLILVSGIAAAQPQGSVASDSRDSALAYIGTTYFIVGRVGSECLAMMGRSETPQQFVGVWQQRNFKYMKAVDIYMGKRLEEAKASGGEQSRAALLNAMIAPARVNGEAVIQGWFKKDGKAKACKRVVALIDAGGFDISPRMPLYNDLEALVSWANKK